MRNQKYIKKGISFLLSAAMMFSGILENTAWIVRAETESDSVFEKTSASSGSFSDEKVTTNLPVLNNVQVRNTEDEEQTELYRCSIPVGHPIELKDILIASGFLEEEDVEDYLSSLKDVSFREEGALRVYSDEENVWYVQAKDNFDNEESIILVDENDIESEIVITDRTVQPVVTLFAEEDDTVHTGSVSFKAEEGFGEEAEVSAELNDNQDAVNAVKASTVIYADYYTFDLGCSEEKAGYEVSMVFPLAVQGKEYRLFHVGEEGVTEFTENVSVTTIEGEEGDQAAAVTFLTDRLGTFVFACTKEFEYQIEQKPYEISITENDPVNLRDVLISTGIISEEYADIFMTYIQSVTSDDPEVLEVVLENEVCTIVPHKHFETAALTVTMLDEQSAEITVSDGREAVLKEEAVSEPEDEEIDLVTIKATNALLPEEAEASASVVDESDEDGSSAMGIEEEGNTKSKSFDISLSNVNYAEYENFEVELKLNEKSAITGTNFRLYHVFDDGGMEEIPVNVITKTDENGKEIVESLSFSTRSFSKFILTYHVDFNWGDYTWRIQGESEIRLSELLGNLHITEVTMDDISEVSFSNEEYISVEKIDHDWILRSLKPFDTTESLTLVLHNGETVSIAVTDEGEQGGLEKPSPLITAPTAKENLSYTGNEVELINPGIVQEGTVILYSLSENGEYSESIPTAVDAGSYTVWYKIEETEDYSGVEKASIEAVISGEKVTVSVVGNHNAEPILYDGEEHNVKGYTYSVSPEGSSYNPSEYMTFTPAETAVIIDGEIAAVSTNAGKVMMGLAPEQFANTNENYEVTFEVTDGYVEVTPAPVTLTAKSGYRNYDREEHTISGFTSSVEGLEFEGVTASGTGTNEGEYPVEFSGVTLNVTKDTTGNYVVTETINGTLFIETILDKALDPDKPFSGSIASYKITVNPNGRKMNDGNALTVLDILQADGSVTKQSIEYGSIEVSPSDGVSYDYSGYTGTFIIPDETTVTITYQTRVLGTAGETCNFSNTSKIGVYEDGSFDEWGSVTVVDEETITPTESDISGEEGDYWIFAYTYADGHLERGLGGAEFRLLDSNQRPVIYKKGEKIGQEVKFTTNETGTVQVILRQEADGIRIRKNTAYYLEMTKTPVYDNGDGTYTYYQKDNTLYSFVITDNPSYSQSGVYTYFNGDVLKVRCHEESTGINVTKRFSGNYVPTDEQKNQIQFILEKENTATGEWDEIERHGYDEFEHDAFNFEHGSHGWSREDYGATFRVREINAEIEGVDLNKTCIVSSQSKGQVISEETDEFLVDPDNESYSFSLVYTNEYSNHKLIIIALDEQIGAYLDGTEFSSYAVSNPSEKLATYITGSDGKTAITRNLPELPSGGQYASDTLYYVVQTDAKAGYLVPDNPEKFYFYFSEQSQDVPEGLPSGETAVDLSRTFDTVTVANHSEKTRIPVIVTWGLEGMGTWPEEVHHVTVKLYKSVNGSDPEDTGKSVELTKDLYFDNTKFTNLDLRDENDKPVKYSLVEAIYDAGGQELTNDYAVSYIVSASGWMVIRNQEGMSLSVSKEWYDIYGQRISDPSDKPQIQFDLFRLKSELTGGTFSRDELEAALRAGELVKENLKLSNENNWNMTIHSLPKTDSSENTYYYYVIETEESLPENNEDTYTVTPAEEGKIRSLTIKNTQTPVTVIIDAKDISKTYGDVDSYDFEITVQESGKSATWEWDETEEKYVATVSDGSKISFTLSRQAGENVGTYLMTPTGEATQAGYRVVFRTGILTINPKSATVKAGASKVYGADDPTLVTIDGLIGEDTITYDVYRLPGENVGTYDIYVSGNERQGNYNVTFENGVLTITQADVTVTAEDKEKVYGEEDPEFTVNIVGLQRGDQETVIQYSLVRQRPEGESGENIGYYAISITGEANQGNYNVTFVNGNLEITRAAATVTVEHAEKIYGDIDPEWYVRIDGLQFDDKEDVIAYTISREAGENKGEYAVTPSGAAVQGNYTVAYVSGKLAILPADLIVTADDIVKGEDEQEDPLLTATITGWKNGDDSAVLTSVKDEQGEVTCTYTLGEGEGEKVILTFTLRREAGSDVGEYIITPKGGQGQSNYNVNFVTGTFAILRVFDIDITQSVVDPVDKTSNPKFDYLAHVDLTGTGLSRLPGFDDDGNKTFSMGKETEHSDNKITLKIPVGAKLTVTQTNTDRDFATSMTLDGEDYPYTGQPRCEIDVDNYYALNFVHSRNVLPVTAFASPDQSEEGAQALEPSGFMALPTNEQAINAQYAHTLETSIGYVIPEDKYYVFDHATLVSEDGSRVYANDLIAVKFNNDQNRLEYKNQGSEEFVPMPAGAVIRLYYYPKYICKIDNEKFFTLNSALEYAGGHNKTATIEMLIGDYGMRESDKVMIPLGYDITITTASSEYEGESTSPAVISRDSKFTSDHMFTNKGKLRFNNIILDGKEVNASKAMVDNINDGKRAEPEEEGKQGPEIPAELYVNDNVIFRNAHGENGGAVYITSGKAVINGNFTNFTHNTAVNGGALYIHSGLLTLNATFENNAANDGGALYIAGGTSVIGNTSALFSTNSAVHGGAFYVSGGNTEISGTVNNNSSTTGGGALFMTGGTVSITGEFTNNNSVNGGAFYQEAGAININGGTISNNTATTNGGMLQTTGGNVNIIGGTISNNTATNGNGGAISKTGPGDISFTGGTISNNTATKGNGGAIYQSSGTITLSGTITGNQAIDGSAVFVQDGVANFKAAAVTDNIASNGGGVGVGLSARLYLSGNTVINNNSCTSSTDNKKRNIYLNVDSDEIINVPSDSLGGSANIGVYVGDAVRENRGEVCKSFGGYVGTNNLSRIKDDRGIYTVYNDSNKLYWGKPVYFYVKYLSSGLPSKYDEGTELLKKTTYYPRTTENSIFDLVTVLYGKYYSDKIQSGYTYSYSFVKNSTGFEKHLISINWDPTNRKWVFNQNDGTFVNNQTEFSIYYSDASYLLITNNTLDKEKDPVDLGYPLKVNVLDVFGKNAVDDHYGYVTAINNVTQNKLKSITEIADEDGNLNIEAGGSLRLVFPGAKGQPWNIDGVFEKATASSIINYTLDPASGSDPQTLDIGEDGSFSLNGNLKSDKGEIYEVLFGNPTPICKVEKDEIEHPFTSLNEALDFIKSEAYGQDKTGTIEMLMDYQQPKDDILEIPEGYNITLKTAASKTAASSGKKYYYSGVDPDKATISRSSGDMGSAVKALINDKTQVLENDDEIPTSLKIDHIIFDGKALGQGGEGGAIKTSNVDVSIDYCEFKGYTASRGGAVYTKWGRLSVTNSNFTDCKIISNQDKTGGGGIWTTAQVLTVAQCDFTNCSCTGSGNPSSPQAGAIFHNIRYDDAPVHPEDGQKFPTGFSSDSETHVTDCHFMNCTALGSGGTLESDAWMVYIDRCTFNGSQTTKGGGNGGAINIYTNDNKNVPATSTVEVTNCSFENCSASNGNTNGGAIRTLSYNLKVSNSTFKNTFSNNTGGAISMTTAGTKLEIYGCEFDNCTSGDNSGAVKANANYLTIDGLTNEEGEITRRTVFKNCSSKKYGAVWQNRNNANGIETIINNTDFIDCSSTVEKAGAVYAQSNTLKINGVTFTRCSAAKEGGALYHSGSTQTLENTSFTSCTSNSSGGGAYLANAPITANNLRFTECKAVNNGGGLYISPTGTSNFTDCDFSNNFVTSSESKGGSFYINQNTVNMNGGSVSASKATNGGGIYQAGTLNINDVTISECYATEKGGGIYQGGTVTADSISINSSIAKQGGGIYSSGSLTIKGSGTVNGCKAKNVTIDPDTGEATIAGSFTADNFGGGIYKNLEKLDLTSAGFSISGCQAYDGGGVYYAVADKAFTFSAGTIGGAEDNRNTAARNGGGIYQSAGTLTLSGGSLIGNTAAENGGGVYQAGGTATMSGGNISQNEATVNGGGVFASGNTFTLSGGTIGGSADDANTAVMGAGVFVDDGTSATFGSSTGAEISYNAASTAGGGIAVDGDGSRLYFTGLVTVKNNYMGPETAPVICNVYLDLDNNAIINTNSTALNGDSYIGVYTSEEQTADHGVSGKPFGSYGNTSNLSCFVNDRTKILTGATGSDNHIIWGSFICKITDGSGNLLYTDQACTSAAAYLKLENNGDSSSSSAAGTLNNGSPALYKDGALYKGEVYQIQMLVSEYVMTQYLSLKSGKTITITTASTEPDAFGLYYNGGPKNPEATIIRGANNFSMIQPKGANLNLIKVIIDGGSKKGYSTNTNGGVIYMTGGGTVTIGENATIRNSLRIDTGNYSNGAIRIQDTETSRLILKDNALITNCEAPYGAAISIKKGSLTMQDESQITDCRAQYGGAVRVDTTMYMSGGTISGNSATIDGGGISLGTNYTEVYFSGDVKVIGNTLNGEPCNVQLGVDVDHNHMIYTGEEGLSDTAEIGIYAAPGTNPYTKHGDKTKPFATWKSSDNLYCFLNDVNGYRGGMMGETDEKVYWIGEPMLDIRKTVVSDWSEDKDVEFNFTVQLGENHGLSPTELRSYGFNGDGLRTVKLKDSASVSIVLPTKLSGKTGYTVTELVDQPVHAGTAEKISDCFTTKAQKDNKASEDSYVITGILGENVTPGEESTSTTVLKFTNTRITGDFTLSKAVISRKPDFAQEEFSYILTLGDATIGDATEGKIYNAVKKDSQGVETPTTVTFKLGIADNITLKHGESITIKDLPIKLPFNVKETLEPEKLNQYMVRVSRNSEESVPYDVTKGDDGVIGEVSEESAGKIVYLTSRGFTNNELEVVCKIVTGQGRNLLYYKDNGVKVPAVYRRLEDAFTQVNNGGLITEQGGSASGTFRIEMIVKEYTMEEGAELNAGRTVILSTALIDDDNYPYNHGEDDEEGNKALVLRGFNGSGMITTSGTLTVDKITLDGNKDNHYSENNGGIVHVNEGSRLTVNQDAVMQNSMASNGGAVSLGSSAQITMNGTIQNCSANNGGGIYAASGFRSITIGGTVSGCQASNGNGGAICAVEETTPTGTVELINTAQLTGNSANNGNGGAVYSDAPVTIRNTATIGGPEGSGNTASNGGGIYLGANAAFTMNSGTITGNQANFGGGIYVQNTTRITGGTFSANDAEPVEQTGGFGGAIYASESANVTISGNNTVFNGNTARVGGAIYDNGIVTMSGGNMNGNTASANAGAVYVAGGKTLTMTGGTITANKSPEGAISTGEGAVLNFAGNVVINENTNNYEAETDRITMNVTLGYDSNTVINTTGLGRNANIGIYVVDGEEHAILYEHGVGGRNFGTYYGTSPDTANLSNFTNDRFSQLKGRKGHEKPQGEEGNYYVMWTGDDLKVQIYKFDIQMDTEKDEPIVDDDGHYIPLENENMEPASDVSFTLTNVNDPDHPVVVWSGKSTLNDSVASITIPWWLSEEAGGNHATFDPGNVYELRETETNNECVIPAGYWQFRIDQDNSVIWETRPELDVDGEPKTDVNRTIDIDKYRETEEKGKILGDIFYLYNDRKPFITFDANGGTLSNGDLKRKVQILFSKNDTFKKYEITEKDPVWNTKFQNWATEKEPVPGDENVEYYKHGEFIHFCRTSDYDDVKLYAQWIPVVCKITDRDDNLLYIDGSPAIYSKLEAAFEDFNTKRFTTQTGKTATARKIKMLVKEYELKEGVELGRSKTCILTTASKNDKDGYPYDPNADKLIARVSRGFDDGSMITNHFNLTLTNITLDGANDKYSGEDGGIVKVVGDYAQLTVNYGTTLQNSSVQNSSVSGKGGAVFVSNNTTFTMMDGRKTPSLDISINDNKADQGGAVYVERGGSFVMSNGDIVDNVSTGNGAGIYVEENASLSLSGKVRFGVPGVEEDGSIDPYAYGNYSEVSLAPESKNGGKVYTKARQDIYIAEAEKDAPASVTLGGSLDQTYAKAGSIWVWAENEKHYVTLKPFAVIKGTVDEPTYAAFRNARTDDLTLCGGDTYLTGQQGESANLMYWSGGVDVTFLKVDGFGTTLADAEFTLYYDKACSEPLKQKGEDAVAVSADGVNDKDRKGNILPKGTVLFENIPVGIFFLKETSAPQGYENNNIYVALVGEANLTVPEERTGLWVDELADITQDNINAQRGEKSGTTGKYERDAAIFLIDKTTLKAVAIPDIAKYGVINDSVIKKNVILRKINEDSENPTPLSGAQFEIYRYDRTVVTSKDKTGQIIDLFTSGDNGIFFIDMLPYGTYYLYERTAPDGYAGNKWFILTVSETELKYEDAGNMVSELGLVPRQ